MNDPRGLRYRAWLNGKLVDEQWLDVDGPGAFDAALAIRARHAQLVERARAVGLDWAVELYDPALPPDLAYDRHHGPEARAL